MIAELRYLEIKKQEGKYDYYEGKFVLRLNCNKNVRAKSVKAEIHKVRIS